MTTLETMELFAAQPTLKDLFVRIARLRKVRLADLAPTDDARRAAKEQVVTLTGAGLVGEQKAPFDDLNLYYVTAQGLEVERQLKRL